MIKKGILFYIFLITIKFTFSQNEDSLRVKKLGGTIINPKSTNENKTNALVQLTSMYSKSNSEPLCAYIEAIIIKSTNFSSLFFFHEFEIKFPEIIKRNKLSLIKELRIYLILSNKQGEEIDKSYYHKALSKYSVIKGNSDKVKKVNCDSISLVKNKKNYEL